MIQLTFRYSRSLLSWGAHGMKTDIRVGNSNILPAIAVLLSTFQVVLAMCRHIVTNSRFVPIRTGQSCMATIFPCLFSKSYRRKLVDI